MPRPIAVEFEIRVSAIAAFKAADEAAAASEGITVRKATEIRVSAQSGCSMDEVVTCP